MCQGEPVLRSSLRWRAGVEHGGESCLFLAGGGQCVGVLNVDPVHGVGAPVASQWRLPLIRRFVTFRLIHGVGHDDQLVMGEIVGELPASIRCPLRGTAAPRFR